ncbi:Polycomb group medea [Fusarium acuminatum]|uniref:Polycomb group medea n=1 Tax=Fusarium acuminatum TaxID=5515 RepID=A0ABZ2WK50_9HYPO
MASHHPTSIDAGRYTTIDLTLEDSDSDARRHSPVSFSRAETTTARFAPNFIAERPSSTHAPVSPPKVNRSTASITASQDKQSYAEPHRPASSSAIKLGQKVTTATVSLDDAYRMAKLSSVTASNLAPRQVTPTLEKDDTKSTEQPKQASLKYQTPRKPEWDVAAIAQKLTHFRQDIKDGHNRMTSYIIESTKPTERRVLTGNSLFASLASKPVPAKKGETMRIKSKEHTKLKNNKREDHYTIVRIQTDEERVPRYRFHHVEIKKNILTPNTMLTFVPHLRDLETSEETKYNVWLQELEDIDRKSGFKPMSREEKVRIAVRSEFASTVSLYLESWLDKLSLPGCNKSTLIRYMASREPDDAITPRQKSDILNSHRPAESTTPPEANRAADMFTEAFHRVFHQGQPPNKQIELRDVLLLDESVDSIMETKPTAKDGSSTQNENELEAVEYWLGTYSILGCLVCFSHSCEHGEYDAQNCKRTLSIVPRLSETLKRRRRMAYDEPGTSNGLTSSSQLCKRNCYRSSPRPVALSIQPPWKEEDRYILRCIVAAADHSQVKKDTFCMVAQLLDRDCSDVFNEHERMNLSLPPPEPATKLPIRTISWYDRFKKTLIGDWETHTHTHEHQRRELSEPCSHEGKSDQGKKRPRRPTGEGVARKAPKTDKKKPAKGKKSAQVVPEEDLLMADTLGFTPKPLRKRKKGIFEEDSEEEEYHPTGTDASRIETPSDGESDFGNGKASAARLRKRAQQSGKAPPGSQGSKSRGGDPKVRGKRGGARPGSGRPRKYPRAAPKPTSAPTTEQEQEKEQTAASVSEEREEHEDKVEGQIVVPDTIVPGSVLQRVYPTQPKDSMEDVTVIEKHTEESMLLQNQLEDDIDDDDDDQDVVVRSRIDRGVRHRRPTAKLRDDGGWMSGSQ